MYKVLPFGLKDSPWVFSRLVATVIAHLRLQGIRIFYYLDDWLHRRRVSISPSVTSSNHSSVGSESGFIVNLKKSVFTPQKMPVYLGASLDIRSLIARPVEPRVFGSSVAHPGTRRVSDGSCPPVAESSRTFGQPCGSGSKLQASHAASSVALPSILYSSVRLSVEADSDVSRNQGSVCSLGVSGSSPRRENRSPHPPTPWC